MNELKEPIYLKCPHCNNIVEIIELNCKIFRHGVLIENGIQMNSHASKETCNYLIAHNKIYGCGKPFQIIIINDNYSAVICDYI